MGEHVTFRQNCQLLTGNCCKCDFFLQDNGSPEEHAIYVWDHFISQSAAENVFFVAHSYGGLAFVELVSMPFSLPSFLRSSTDFQSSLLLSSSNSSLGTV